MVSKKMLLSLLVLSCLLSACSVMSEATRRESEPDADFPNILANIEQYQGKTVILGGYILSIQNQATESVVEVLQSPLTFGDEPRRRDMSQGRFILRHGGFLDPEVFRKGRRLTVAGEVLGSTQKKVDERPHTYLELKSREMYLWSTSTHYYGPYWHRWHHYPFHPYPWGPWRRHYPYYPYHPYY